MQKNGIRQVTEEMSISGPTNLEKWFPKQELEEIESLLDAIIPDEIAGLQKQIALFASWQGRLAKLLADAESLLDYAEQQALMTRNEDWTDMDRKVNMRASTRNERRVKNILEGFSKALRSKLIAMQSLKRTLLGEITEMEEG